jgi:acyl carrier protein
LSIDIDSSASPDTFEPEPKIADIVHRLLQDRSIDREFGFKDNLRDSGLSSLDMTSLVFAVEADFAIEIPDRAVTPVNFTSIASIGHLVRTHRPGAATERKQKELRRNAAQKLRPRESLTWACDAVPGATHEWLQEGGSNGPRLPILYAGRACRARKGSLEEMKIARRRRKVLCFQISDAARKAAADN